MTFESVESLERRLTDAISLDEDVVTVVDMKALQAEVDSLVTTAVFGEGLTRETARWLLWELGQVVGIYPASIHELYMAAGRGELPHSLTVPAINIRAMNFNTARAVFRAAIRLNVGALIFEIARSEMGYTDQRPAEYVSSLIGAAIKEGFTGPLFVQGDHFQVSAKNHKADSERETETVRELIREAVEAGFYNIDIDTSTLVDLSYDTLDGQQQTNYRLCAALTSFVREVEPEGITVSLGGEIGEVGGHNSTVPELRTFMDGFTREIGDLTGLSKISVQTGTSHGGVVLPDGTLAQVKVDFDTLGELSRVSRIEYGLGGAVQHGASTLPPSAFNKFPEVGAIEIHLATNFQNIIYDNLPHSVVDTAYNYILSNHRDEWKQGQTEDQFIYTTRKKAIGPFKRQWWRLDTAIQERIGAILEEQFEFLFQKLAVSDTRDFAHSVTSRVEIRRPRPKDAVEQEALEIASDLAD